MSASIPAPTLSTQGWVRDPSEKLDSLLAWFFLSEQNQSQLYSNEITSLPKIIQQHNNDANKIATTIKEELSTYLGEYFEGVEVNMGVTQNPSNASKIDLTLAIGITDNEISANYKRLLKIENSKMQEIAKINNG